MLLPQGYKKPKKPPKGKGLMPTDSPTRGGGREAFNQRWSTAAKEWDQTRKSAVANRKDVKAPLAPEGYTPAAPGEHEPYRRFDWKTPGAGIEEMGIDSGEAASRLRTFLDTDFNALDQSINDRTKGRKVDRFKALSSGGGGIESVMPDVIGRKQLGDEGYAQLDYDRSLQTPVNRQMVAWIKENAPGITSESSDEDLSQAFDAFIRYQQAKNQMPKRSLMRSLPGKIVLGGLGALAGSFLGPAISGLAGKAGIPSGLLSAGKTASSVLSGVGKVKDFTGGGSRKPKGLMPA